MPSISPFGKIGMDEQGASEVLSASLSPSTKYNQVYNKIPGQSEKQISP